MAMMYLIIATLLSLYKIVYSVNDEDSDDDDDDNNNNNKKNCT
jgi:hypothetical protein